MYYGKKIYEREQVIKKKYNKKSYENHCWNCHEDISSDFSEKCDCGMFICSSCDMCICDRD